MSERQSVINFIAVFTFFLVVAIFWYAHFGSFCMGTFYLGPFFLDLHKTSTFWGITVSAVALVTASYLVILTLNASTMVKEVNELKEKTKREVDSLRESRKNFADSLWESYTNQYNLLCKQGKGGSLASKLLRSRGQLGYLFPMLEEKNRVRPHNTVKFSLSAFPSWSYFRRLSYRGYRNG